MSLSTPSVAPQNLQRKLLLLVDGDWVGGMWCAQTSNGEFRIRAPARFIEQILHWCAHGLTPQELDLAAARDPDGSDLLEFVDELVSEGVVGWGRSEIRSAAWPKVVTSEIEALEDMAFQLTRTEIFWSPEISSLGWGRDRDHVFAADKALSEAVERHAWQQIGDAILAPAVCLDHYIPPKAIVAYDPEQYRRPEFPFAMFDEHEPRWWVQAQCGERKARVLADCVLDPIAFPAAYRRRLYTSATTSGCATDASVATAKLRAALELFERDAMMRQWRAQEGGIRISVASIPADLMQRLQRLENVGCHVQVQCLVLGLYPAWAVWAQHEDAHFTCIGTATGLEPGQALECAIAELETHAWARLQGIRPSLPPTAIESPADHASLYATPAYFRNADALLACVRKSTYQEACMRFCTEPSAFYSALRTCGQELWSMDMTVPQAPRDRTGQTLHTVRAVAPGLLPLCFGTGRLPLGMGNWHKDTLRFVHPFA